MSRWFRFYTDAVSDPKVQSLPSDVFKTWVNLLCVAGKHDGKLPTIHELTYQLSGRKDKLDRHLTELISRGLIDIIDDHFEPHNWRNRQYKSDTSAARTKDWRDRQCDVTAAVTVTPPDNRVQNTDTEKNNIRAQERARDYDFEKFWTAYPKRASASPKKPARLKYDAARKRGVSRETIFDGARSYAAECDRLEKTGTQYVKTPEVWLGQEGWSAFAEQPSNTGPPPDLDPIARRDWIRKQMEQDGEKNEGSATGDRNLLAGSNGFREADQPDERSRLVRPTRRNAGSNGGLAPLFSGAIGLSAGGFRDDASPENQDVPRPD